MTDQRNAQEPAISADFRCRGKAFEYHERTEITGDVQLSWRFPDCGDKGTVKEMLATLVSLVPLMDKLREQFYSPGIVFLVPSDAAPGKLGEFYGCDVYRVQGIPAPMVAMTALQVPRR